MLFLAMEAVKVGSAGAPLIHYSQWDLFGAILSGSVGGGIVAVLGQRFSDWLRRPKIKLCIGSASQVDTPYIANGMQTTARYLRLKVENRGGSAAHGCRVFVKRMEKIEPNSSSSVIVDDDWFDLLWSYGKISDGTAFVIVIPQDTKRYADICFSVENGPTAGLNMASNNFPIRIEDHFQTSGKFKIDIVVSGDNFKPSEHRLCSIFLGHGTHYISLKTSNSLMGTLYPKHAP